MVALNTQERYSKIFLRYGQVPLGQNPDAEPSLEEITLSEDSIPAKVVEILDSDDVFSLAESYGNPVAGDPATFDFLRITLKNGREKEIEVFNMAIMMFMDNREETRRIFRIINAIKGEDETQQPLSAALFTCSPVVLT